MKYDISVIGSYKALLGESPLWDADKGVFRYLDIDMKKAVEVDLETGKTSTEDLPDKAGSMALCSDGSRVFAMVDGVYNDRFERICEREATSGIRFNDGKPSPDGRYFVGTIEKGGNGKLYCLENGELHTVLDGVKISNGIDWSLDGKTVYYCDTATRKIVSFDFPQFTGRKVIIDFSLIDGFEGNPDGMCIDKEGNLWVAVWNGSSVVRVDTESGSIIDRVELPAKKISCPAFVGKNLDILAVTSSSEDADDQPEAGRCFSFKPSVGGRAPYKIDIKHIKV